MSSKIFDDLISKLLTIRTILMKRRWDYIIRKKFVKNSLAYIFYLYYKIFKSSRQFVFRKKSYKYFYHMYNYTWIGERAVEIPIIWEIVKKQTCEKILEVGNVLSHYFPITHDVLDKYERGDVVINQDIVNFKPSQKYDLIVSISTLEHVGWDEIPRQPDKVLSAIANLKKLLISNGKIIITLPVGYNNEVDRLLREKKLGLTSQYNLKRISRDNIWKEVEWKDIKNAKYGYPYNAANGVVVGVINA